MKREDCVFSKGLGFWGKIKGIMGGDLYCLLRRKKFMFGEKSADCNYVTSQNDRL